MASYGSGYGRSSGGVPTFNFPGVNMGGSSGGGLDLGDIWSKIGGGIQDAVGDINWGKVFDVGAGAFDAINAFNANKTNAANSKQALALQALQVQLQKDRLAMDDQQFAAKYGMDKQQAQFEIDKFNRTQESQEGLYAAELQDKVNSAPLRDRAQYMTQARLGAAPQAFTPRDITRGPVQQQLRMPASAQGGPAANMPRMQQAANSYYPGAGGVNMDVHKTLINRFMNPQATGGQLAGTYQPGVGYSGPGVTPPPPAQAQQPLTNQQRIMMELQNQPRRV